MRKIFSEYYRPTPEQFKVLWKECLFVFDANVLLNLYRYPQEAREDLLKVITAISDRIWLPYQAALEYQQNRIDEISKQTNRFQHLKSSLEKAENIVLTAFQQKHAYINSDAIKTKLKEVFSSVSNELQTLQETQTQIYKPDDIREKIDSLFEGKVGEPPQSQEKLQKLYDEGKIRYEQRRPPGFKDKRKGDTESDQNEGDEKQERKKKETMYFANGLIIERKYGDLLVWKQIIERVLSDDKVKKLIFVTDDKKEDWWWMYGSKTIGPRPELVHEVLSEGKLDLFYMYDTEQFIKYAKEYLSIEVKNESLQQIKEITEEERLKDTSILLGGRHRISSQSMKRYNRYELAVLRWIRKGISPDTSVMTLRSTRTNDLLLDISGVSIGLKIAVLSKAPFAVEKMLEQAVADSHESKDRSGFDKVILVIINRLNIPASVIAHQIDSIPIPSYLSIVIGKIIHDEDQEHFYSQFEINWPA